jgi:DNA end-binding protein Ku
VHAREEVVSDTLAADKPYFLTPGKSCQPGAYGLLKALIEANADKAFCTVFAAKGKPAMYVLGVYDGVVTLQKLAWPGDVKALPAVPSEYDEAFVAMAQTLIDQLLTPFDASTYKDAQREQREAMVAAKVDDAAPIQSLPDKVPSNVSNGLMAALQASVEATKAAPKAKAKRKSA